MGQSRVFRRYAWGFAALGLAVLTTCATCVFIETPPQKIPTPLPVSTASPGAQAASQQFWTALHGNDYAALPDVIAALTNADAQKPNDPTLTMLLGLSYAWLDFEQYRADAPRTNPQYAALLAQASRATEYLARAQQLAPRDRIVPGFTAAGQMALARAHHDSAGEAAASQALTVNTKNYPEFQGFVQGWVLTALYPPDDHHFAEGISAFFSSLDTCVGFSVSQTNPSAPGFVFNILAKADPACYNTDIAPHNLEGTFLALGDAFAKQGQLASARAAYENILRVPSYKTWKYQSVLQARLAQLDQLPAKFTAVGAQTRSAAEPAMFFLSPYACTACHAQ